MQNECALLKYFDSFSAAELNNIESEDEVLLRNFHAKRVIFKIAMMNIFNNCIGGSLNNNYFPIFLFTTISTTKVWSGIKVN